MHFLVHNTIIRSGLTNLNIFNFQFELKLSIGTYYFFNCVIFFKIIFKWIISQLKLTFACVYKKFFKARTSDLKIITIN